MLEKEILLVEDNPDDEELVTLSLMNAGIRNPLHVARDGAQAIEYLFSSEISSETLPAVVLLDLNLPKIDGLEVLRRIRADGRTALLPVVILTSSDADEDIVASYRLGASSYVRKPIEFSEFAAAVRQLGLYWLLLNEPPDRS